MAPEYAQAAIVRDMFALYAAGHSYAGIAAELNRRKIEAPRSKRRAGEGWQVSSVRAMLRNPKYAGAWTFGGRTFKRHPTSRKRKALRADPAELVTTRRPELRIIPEELWTAVQARLAQTHAAYTRPGARVIPNPKTDYLLSGVLRCAECGSLMEIMRGSHASYYRCSANRRRGPELCSNRLSVREDVAKSAILSTLSDQLWNPETLLAIRETVAREAGAHHRQVEADLKDRTARLARVEQRLRGLVEMQLDGDTSETVRTMRADHEAQAAQERHAIDLLRAELTRPVHLPSPGELAEDRILGLDALHEARGDDVAPAREQLKTLLDGGAIRLHPKPADPKTGAPAHYIAEGGLLPLGLLIPTNAETPHEFIGGASRDALRAVSCAGTLPDEYTGLIEPVAVVLHLPPPEDRRKRPGLWRTRGSATAIGR